MGVIQLWSILEPVKQHIPLSELSGLTLAVDLSIWVCESNAIKQMQGVVSKPHLRNLFFRVSNLTHMGIKLIFAIDGEAPDLKSCTMAKRQQARFPGKKNSSLLPKTKRKGRSQFNNILKECCELLDHLGVPYVYSRGEAEALCAFLDSQGIVDGCLTDDGDAFLYGAKTVYRNFTLNAKDPHVESYKACDIEDTLGLKQEGLIGLALLLGCDYLPKGVPGVGKEQVLKLIKALESENILDRFSSWTPDLTDLDGIEKMVWKKAMKVPDFPNQEVIDEFLVTKDSCPVKSLHQRRPWIEKSKSFLYEKLDWPTEYTEEKILPLLTLWDMRDISDSRTHNEMVHLIPHRIVKRRVRQGVPSMEIEWNRQDNATEENKYYSTIEEEALFSQCFPEMVEHFVTAETNKKTTKGRKKVKAETKPLDPEICASVDRVIDTLSCLTLDGHKSTTSTFTDEDKPNSEEKISINKPRNQDTVKTTSVRANNKPQTSSDTCLKTSAVEGTCLSSANVINDEPASPSEYVPLSQRIKLKLKTGAYSITCSQSEKTLLDKDRRLISSNPFNDVRVDKMNCETDKESVVKTHDESARSSNPKSIKPQGCFVTKHSIKPNPTKGTQNYSSVKQAGKIHSHDNPIVKPATITSQCERVIGSVKPVVSSNSICHEITYGKNSYKRDKGDNSRDDSNSGKLERGDNPVCLLDTQHLLHDSTFDVNVCLGDKSKKYETDSGPILADLDSNKKAIHKFDQTDINQSTSVVEDQCHLDCSMNNSSLDLFSPGIAHNTSPINHIKTTSSASCRPMFADKILLPEAVRTPMLVKNKHFNTVLFDTPNFGSNSPGYGVFNIETSLLNVTGDKLIYSITPKSEIRKKEIIQTKQNDMALMNSWQDSPLTMNKSLFDVISTPVSDARDNCLSTPFNTELEELNTQVNVYQDLFIKPDTLQMDLDHILRNCSSREEVTNDISDSPDKNKLLDLINTCCSSSVDRMDNTNKNTFNLQKEIVSCNKNIENIEFETCVTKMKSVSVGKEVNVPPPSSPLSLVDRLRAKMVTSKQSEQLYNDTLLSVKGPLQHGS